MSGLAGWRFARGRLARAAATERKWRWCMHRSCVLLGVTVLAWGVLVSLAGQSSRALAASWARGVEAVLPANASSNPFPDRRGGLGPVSCASAGNCSAVSSYTDGSGNSQGLLLNETSGMWARGVEASLPSNAGSNPHVVLPSVACVSAGNCSAVGRYTDSSGNKQGLLLNETSGTWAHGVEASLPANAAYTGVVLASVSCVSAGNCTAVGRYTNRSGDKQGLFVSESSGTWTQGVEASLPSNAGSNPSVVLSSVSCVSAGNCTAVGRYTDTSGDAQGLLLNEASGAWTQGVEATPPANASSNPFGVLPGFGLGPVSCVSAGNCTAVGNYADRSDNREEGLRLTETSGRWARGVEATPPVNAGSYPGVYWRTDFGSVSCPSAVNCMAVGGYEDSSAQFQGLLLSETSGTWARGIEPALPANAGPRSLPSGPDTNLDSVSCASAGNCTAVGDYADSAGNNQGLLLTESSGTWAPGVEADLPANAAGSSIQDAALGAVSCASAGNCAAFGSYLDRSGHLQGLLVSSALPPRSTRRPVISGIPRDGHTLRTTHGSWSRQGPLRYAYQWRRCSRAGRSCKKITGATRRSYRLTQADIGHKITVRVRATDQERQAGHATARPIGPVRA